MAALAHPTARMRMLTVDDLATVSEMELASYEFPWSPGIFGDCLRAGYPCWALIVDDAIAGYGILSMGAGEAHVLNVCVAAQQRRQGLGRYLMCRLLDCARWNGAERVFLEVRPSNVAAQLLYESIGFREIGRRPRYYPAREGREEAIVMALDLLPR